MGCGISSLNQEYQPVTDIFIKDGEWVDSFEMLLQINNIDRFNKHLDHLCKTQVLFELQEAVLKKIFDKGNIEGLWIVMKYYPNISNVVAANNLPNLAAKLDYKTLNKENLRALAIFMRNCKFVKIQWDDKKEQYSDIGIVELLCEKMYDENVAQLKQLSSEGLFSFNFQKFVLDHISVNNFRFIGGILSRINEYNCNIYQKIWDTYKISTIRNNDGLKKYIEMHRDKMNGFLGYKLSEIKSQHDIDFITKLGAKLK